MAELSITEGLREISQRLTEANAIAKGAVTCAENGSEREALRIAMDLDELLSKGLWDRAESLEGTVAAYRQVKGLKELMVARGPHAIDTWTPAMLDHLADRVVAFGRAAILGESAVPGAAAWTTMRDLVGTSVDDWEPSSRP